VQPVTVTATTAKPVEDVYDFLDLLANHEPFVDHLFTDWSFSGPARGVGAGARARTNAPGSQDWTEFEVVESEAPSRIVERAVGAGGKRRTQGTYALSARSGGGTEIRFSLEWIEAARLERLFGPLTRAFVRRANGKSMRRLVRLLESSGSA
jgi:Polyketide cyclase / dehydrase and lipid transport